MPDSLLSTIRTRQSYIRELLLGVHLSRVSTISVLKNLRRGVTSESISLLGRLSGKLALIITTFVIVGLTLSAIFFLPQIYYRIFPAQVVVTETVQQGTVLGGDLLNPQLNQLEDNMNHQ